MIASAEQFGAGWNRFWFTPSDAAALSAIRIATGVMALYWQLTYTPDLVELFGLQALISLETLDQWQGNSLVFTYFDERLSTATLMSLHFAGTAVLLLFTLGVLTRVTSVAALIVTLSYVNRGPMLTLQMEPILAFVQFYLCLGPSGAAFSWDAWRRRRRAAERGDMALAEVHPSSWVTVATRMLQVHVTIVYVMMSLAKIGSPAWWNGSAIWWLVARPESAGHWLTTWLAPHLSVIEAWTHAVLLFELSFPLLVWNRLTRPFVLLLSFPMWVLLGMATGLYTFAAMMLIANLAFVPPEFVRALLGQSRSVDQISAAASPQRAAGSAKTTSARANFNAHRRSGQSA